MAVREKFENEKLEEYVEFLKSTINEKDAEINKLKGNLSLDDLKKQYDEILSRIGNLEEKIENHDKTLNKIFYKGKISDIIEDKERLEEEKKEAEAELEETQKQIDEVSSIKENSVSDQLDAFQAQVDEDNAKARLEEVSEKILDESEDDIEIDPDSIKVVSREDVLEDDKIIVDGKAALSKYNPGQSVEQIPEEMQEAMISESEAQQVVATEELTQEQVNQMTGVEDKEEVATFEEAVEEAVQEQVAPVEEAQKVVAEEAIPQRVASTVKAIGSQIQGLLKDGLLSSQKDMGITMAPDVCKASLDANRVSENTLTR